MMLRLSHERVLLIGDSRRELEAPLLEAAPAASLTRVSTLFDGIAELSANSFTTVVAAAEPLERRPEAAVRMLRELAGEARLLLFGHPTLEILARKMLEFGCDDYLIMPVGVAEWKQVFGTPSLRLANDKEEPDAAAPEITVQEPPVVEALSKLPLAELLLDALTANPQDALKNAIQQIQQRIAPQLELQFAEPNQSAPQELNERRLVSCAIRAGNQDLGTLHLLMPADHEESVARHALVQICQLLGKVAGLQDRHNRLQRLAITDELTGLSNSRYFRHFLNSILDRARSMHFPVTLLLFDIDDFKKYNDQYGHATGDEILRQAATLMRRCTRQHDLVARIGGDEFAVVFWDKEGPRQPREPKSGVSSRPPQEPLQIFERFKRLIASEEFPLLGQTGKGQLTVSAGLAVFPWDATDAESLIREADKRLMMGAKKAGKNAIYIVGTDDPGNPPG